jgi:hypothetical protein
MEDNDFRKQAILLKKREEIKIGRQCTNIFKNAKNLISTLQSEDEDSSKLFLNEILKDSSSKLEMIA